MRKTKRNTYKNNRKSLDAFEGYSNWSTATNWADWTDFNICLFILKSQSAPPAIVMFLVEGQSEENYQQCINFNNMYINYMIIHTACLT